MLIIGYKPGKKLEAKYEKKGYAFRWVLPHKIARRGLDSWEVAHRKHQGNNIPIEQGELTLMGKRQ